jgi:hypothetical protein
MTTIYPGNTLTATPATVTNLPTPTTTWQWISGGINVSGATASTYTVQVADIGKQIGVQQTATNFLGTDSAFSLPTVAVSWSPAALYNAGEQGAWFEAFDLTTLFQTDDTSTPVTAAGQTVGRWSDKSGRNNHASNATLAQRPLYQVTPTRLTLDKSDDRLTMTVPAGGFVGTMVLATPEGTAAYGVNIPAGSYNIGGRGGTGAQYFPGTAMQGYVIRNGALSASDTEAAITYLRDNGGGPNYGGVTNFTNFWRDRSEITSFPLVDTSAGTNFQSAWRGCSSLTSFPLINTAAGTSFQDAWFGCSSLTSFPLINTSAGTSFQGAWRGCSSLTSFPLINTAAGTNFTQTWFGCSSLTSFPLINTSAGTNFSFAWQNCTSLATFPANFFDGCAATNFTNAFTSTALNQASIDGILVSINSNGTSNGTFNQSGGSAPSATGEAAIDALRARGWTISVTGGY